MNSAGNGRQPVFYSIINNDYYNKESFIKKDMNFVQSTRGSYGSIWTSEASVHIIFFW
jgi:hypothetical protein